MTNLNLASVEDLTALGVSEQDAQRIIDHVRDRGPFEHLGLVLEMRLSDESRSALTQAAETGRLVATDPERQGFRLSLLPQPFIEDGPTLAWEVAYRDVDGQEQAVSRPLALDRRSELGATRVSHEDPIVVRVTDGEGGLRKERVFLPPEIHRRRDGDILYAEVELKTVPLLLPEDRRFLRAGRYVVPTKPRQRFDGYRLAAAPVTAAQTARVAELLGEEGDLATGAVQLDPEEREIASRLASFPLGDEDFDFDGSFTVDRHLPETSGEYIGWVWLLAGRSVFFGFQADDALTTPLEDLTILLPVFDLEAEPPSDLPFDVSEKALLDRPDLFADDPGVLCKPFDHPGRILGERRFSTILRVTDPDIGSPGGGDGGPGERRPVREAIDWEAEPTAHKARSVARGHILDMRVRYRSNGYSLGDVAHSMTLAPRQTRRIVKVDFERRERALRDEATVAADEVQQTTLRDRAYSDAVRSNLSEWSRGGSRASTSAAAGGLGIAGTGFVIGGGAAHASSRSSSWQSGGRSVSASEVQNLRDAIRQYGDSLRTMESTVVTEVEQSESVEGVSEVVRNINYCHALSVVYYQILRHLRIDTEVGGVGECVFVPLDIKPFDDDRLERHGDVLRRYVRDRDQRRALQYIEAAPDYEIDEIPDGPRKDQELTSLRGSIHVRLGITRPTEDEFAEETEEGVRRERSETDRFRKMVDAYKPFAPLLGIAPTELVHKLLDITESERDRYFQRRVAPHVARLFADQLQVGRKTGSDFTPLDSDFTLVGTYHYGRVVRIDFNVTGLDGVTRADTEELVFKAPDAEDFTLPERSFADVVRGRIHAVTEGYERRVRSRGRFRDDLVVPETGQPEAAGATLRFPASRWEEEDERQNVVDAREELLKTLNGDLYRYHKAIWWRMDRDALYTLLDGFTIEDSTGERRSIAGMVDRRPIGILGNTMVFRVSRGTLLDTNFETHEQLVSFYKDSSPPTDPFRVSLPTSGLYARAHMDSCNACEEHAGSRDWVLDDPDPELADLPASLLGSRRSEPQGLQPTQFPETLINLQNAPAAPDPQGFERVLGALAKGDAFRDMAGLEGTQAGARAGLETAAGLASNFGSGALASKLASLQGDAEAGRDLQAFAEAARNASDKGMMTVEQAQQATEEYARRRAGSAARGGVSSALEHAERVMGERARGTVSAVGEDGAVVSSFSDGGNGDRASGGTGGGGGEEEEDDAEASDPTAQVGGDPDVLDPTDPAVWEHLKPGLEARAQAWLAESVNRSVARSTLASINALDEFKLWAVDPANPDVDRLLERHAIPGSGHADQARLLQRLEAYFRAAHPDRGHLAQQRALRYARSELPWSASFVSWVMRSSATRPEDGFHFWSGHSRYTAQALINRLNRDYTKPFWLFRLDEVPVDGGDIIVKARAGGTLDFDRVFFGLSDGFARVRFEDGEWTLGRGEFTSHADVVATYEHQSETEVHVYTVGGNTEHLTGEVNTVGKKKYLADGDRRVQREIYDALHQDVQSGARAEGEEHVNSSAWAVIKILDRSWFEEWQDRYTEWLDGGRDTEPLKRDTLREVFGSETEDGGRELNAASRALLESHKDEIFPDHSEAELDDIDTRMMFKPVFDWIPPNWA